MGLNHTGVSDHHTTLDFLLVDTTKKETYIVTGFTLIEQLAEHFHTSYNRFLIFTETEDLNFVTYLNDTSFNTTCSNSTTTGDREHIFNRHQEGLIAITFGLLDPSINSFHELHNTIFPFSNTIECAECRTTNDRSLFLEVILREKVLHVHLNELKHFFIVNHVAFVKEHNKTRHVHLTSEKNVFASLRHRTVSRSHYNNSAVHLRSTRYHVLHIVGVTWAVNVSIVTISRLILNVRSIDRDTTFFFLGGIVDLIERLLFGETMLCKYFSDSGSKSSLTVVDVTNRTNVHVRFGTLEMFFCHCSGYI